MVENHPDQESRIRDKAILVLSIALFALGSPLIKWLTEFSAEASLSKQPVVSFCNLLFLGNFIASFVVLFFFGFKNIFQGIRKISKLGWFFVGLSALFSITTPTLIVLALERTSVANTILLSRLGPLLVAVFSSLIYRMKVTKAEWAGYGMILAAILISSTLQGGGLNRGDVLVLCSGVTYWITMLINHKALELVGKPAFAFFRNLGGAVIFGIIAIHQYGPGHFSDLSHVDIWFVVAVYAVVSVAGAQIAWYYALAHNSSKTVGNFSVLGPTLGFLFAFLLVGERPTAFQYYSLLLIVTGLFIANWNNIIKIVFPDSATSTVVGH